MSKQCQGRRIVGMLAGHLMSRDAGKATGPLDQFIKVLGCKDQHGYARGL